MGPPMRFPGRQDKTFFGCGIWDLLLNFVGCEIRIEQTSCGMRNRTKKTCGMREVILFSRVIQTCTGFGLTNRFYA